MVKEEIVGVNLAFYSERCIRGEVYRLCNLAAWCVLEDYRSHSLRLLNGLLGQPGYHFTDLSPSGRVVPLNTRLRFQSLDTATAMVPNLPWLSWSKRTRVTSDRALIKAALSGPELQIYQDHARAQAAQHLLITQGNETCYVMFRRERRKNLPFFASLLHVGNPELFRRSARQVFGYLLFRFGLLATLAELRVVRDRPPLSIMLKRPRPKMYRSDRLQSDQIDYLYSELTCVPW